MNFSGSSLTYKNFLFYYNQAHEYLKQIRQIKLEKDLLRREKNLYEFELSQISEAKISEHEFKKIDEIVTLGNKANQAKKICSEIQMSIINAEVNCLDMLKFSRRNIEKLHKISGQTNLPAHTEQIDGIISLLEEFAHNMELTTNLFDIDEIALSHALQRIEVYNKILQKFGPTCEDVENYKKV